jgi:lysophospholipase L1-like esterase
MGRVKSSISTLLAVAFGVVASLFLGEWLLRAATSLRTPPAARVEETYIQHHPVRGFAQVPNAVTTMASSEFNVSVRINEAGLRMDREIPLARTPGMSRVLFLGNSFTFGQGVEAHQRFTDLIQRDWPQAEILNFGIPGTGTDQQLLHFREQGTQYAPDLVVLCFFVGCATRNSQLALPTPQGWRPKPRFEMEQGSLILTHVPVPDTLVTNLRDLYPYNLKAGWAALAKRFLREHSRLYSFLRSKFASNPVYDSTLSAWQLTAAIVREMAKEVRGSGSQLAVAFLPSREEADRGGSSQLRDQVRDLCSELDVPFLDLLTAFQEKQTDAVSGRDTPLYFPKDKHWTAEGHALAARELLPWVKELASNGQPH